MMTIEEAESERYKLMGMVKYSDAGSMYRADYLCGWIDCYKQLDKPKAVEEPLKVKDFPKKTKKGDKERGK